MPIDPTPHFGEIMQTTDEPDFPKRKDGTPKPADNPDSADIAARPDLPGHPEQMAADIEDEEDDPVVDTGPGIADGPSGLDSQRG